MTSNNTRVGDLVIAHYGSALKEAVRNASGAHVVYGSSGEVGRHDQALVDFPTVVIGRKGSVGAVTYAPQGGWPIDTTFYLEMRHPDQVDLRYLYWALSRAGLDRRAITTSIPGLNRDELYRTRIPLPPLAEQRRIAAVLDKADAIRRKRRESLRLLDEFLRSAFLEMFGDAVKNEKAWEVVELGVCFVTKPIIGTITRGSDDGELRLVRVGELGEHGVAIDRCARVTVSDRDASRFEAQPGDLLLARAIGSEQHLGKASVLQTVSERVIFDSHVMRLRFDPNRLRASFFWQWLQTAGGRRLFLKHGGRTAVQFNINASQVAEVRLALPPIEEQERFLELASRARLVQQNLGEAVTSCGRLFNSLVQRTFRGDGR